MNQKYGDFASAGRKFRVVICVCKYEKKCAIVLFFLLSAIIFSPAKAFATNGINLTGYGAESSLMGGADVAIARDSLAVNTNPAGIVQLDSSAFDGYVEPTYAMLSHKDEYGNDKESQSKYAVLFGAGYATRLEDTNIYAGVGVFVQGGIGYEYRDLRTAFGTTDEASSSFSIVKVEPALAFQITEYLSVGIAIGVSYQSADFALFPNTSYTQAGSGQTFFGTKLNDAHGYSYGARVGIFYRPNSNFTIGTAYSEKTSLPLKDGKTGINMSAVGLGNVEYTDSRLNGISLPREWAIGSSVRIWDNLLLAFEVNWLDWSSAIGDISLKASNPNDASSPSEVIAKFEQNWRDQYVLSLAGEYRINDTYTIIAGYNYGKNPIPRKNLTPTSAVIAENHFDFGVIYQLSQEWHATMGVEIQPHHQITYTNENFPFGRDSVESNEGIFMHFMLSRRW